MNEKANANDKPATKLALSKYFSLFVSDKRAEGRSPKYLEWITWHLGRFRAWHETQYGEPPALRDFDAVKVREFIIFEQQRPRWKKHPIHAEDGKPLSNGTLRGMVRAFKVFSAWLSREGHTRAD